MKLEYFEYIRAINLLGTISKAAEHLGVSQPYLSLELKNLEKELNVVLLYRSSKGVELSEAGKIFYKYSLEILKLVDEIKNPETLEPYGQNTLSIASMYSYTFLDIYYNFNAICMKSGSKVSYEEMPTESIAEKIRSSQYDIGFVYLDRQFLAKSINHFKSMGLKFEPLFTEELAVVLNSQDKLAKAKGLTMEELQCYSLILEKSKQSPHTQIPIRDIVLDFKRNFTLNPVDFDSNRTATYYLTRDTNSFSLGQYYLNTANPFYKSKEIVYVPLVKPSMQLTTGILTLENIQDAKNAEICEQYIKYVKQYLLGHEIKFPLDFRHV